jgi:hypothetical protein
MAAPKYADIRFNSGMGALLCNGCRVILKYGFEHEDKKHYCEKCKTKARDMWTRGYTELKKEKQ